jgi:uncharacterized protein
MQYKFVSENLAYDGSQLRSLFGYLDHKILGDSFISFIGPCDIPFSNMVDGEDFLAGSEIRGGLMLHFIIEEFGKTLELAVTRQRLLASLVREELARLLPNKSFIREGDDIYVDGGKLSISIATVSPVSALIHFAVNITNDNTPVKTAALNDFKISPKDFSDSLGAKFLSEVASIDQACRKVHWVK